MMSDNDKLQIIRKISGNENGCIPSLDEPDWNDLMEFSRKQGVMCYLYSLLRRQNSESIIPEAWRSKIRLQMMYNTGANIKHLLELEELSLTFEKAKIPVIFLKGSHLAFHVYPTPSLRAMCDIDLFVREEDLVQCTNILRDSAYQSEYYDLENVRKNHRHLPNFTKKGKKNIELHWTLLDPIFHNASTKIIQHWLIHETEQKNFGNGRALVLKPDAELFYLMLQIGMNDQLEVPLKNMVDLTVCIEKYQHELHWDVIAGKIRMSGFVRRFALVAWLAKHLVAAPFPNVFFEALHVEISREIQEAAINKIIRLCDVDFHGPFPAIRDAGIFQKIHIILSYICIPPSLMKFRYKLKNNWEAIIFYPGRIFIVAKKYKSTLLQIVYPGKELRIKSREEVLLRSWLEDG